MISRTRLPTITNVQRSGNQIKDTIYKATSATLGVSKPGKRYINRDTWLWNDDIETKVCEKKRPYQKFLDDKTPVNWQIYKNANREAKLGPERTDRDLYRLAKSRNERMR